VSALPSRWSFGGIRHGWSGCIETASLSRSIQAWWTAVAGLAVCAFATAGACAVAGGIGLGMAVGGRVLGIETKTREEGGGQWSQNDFGKMLLGMSIDIAAWRIPSVRNANGSWSGKGVAGQTAWTAVSLPNSWAPWQGACR
jgi:hypothetical protein